MLKRSKKSNILRKNKPGILKHIKFRQDKSRTHHFGDGSLAPVFTGLAPSFFGSGLRITPKGAGLTYCIFSSEIVDILVHFFERDCDVFAADFSDFVVDEVTVLDKFRSEDFSLNQFRKAFGWSD